MANFGDWVRSARGTTNIGYVRRSTAQTYTDIFRLGLEAPDFMAFSFDADDSAERVAPLLRKFISKGKPCLFIWDPLKPGLKKDFLMDVTLVEQAEHKLCAPNFRDFSYLVTTQVNNPGDGFVGSVISDGKGRLFGETYHRPGVYNQRELSQPKGDISQYLQAFAVEDNKFLATDAGFLSRPDVRRMIGMYAHLPGYFEFVKGKMLGKDDFYTTGNEGLQMVGFPEGIHTDYVRDARKRMLAILAKPF